jgi:hypothetical protein
MPAVTDASAAELRKGERVVAAVDFPGIPEGTPGKVTFVAGFDWIRYWVRFENGATKGSINRKKLARPDEWRDLLARRERGEVDEEPAADGDAGGAGDAPAADTEVDASGVPAHLLERSRARRAALGK